MAVKIEHEQFSLWKAKFSLPVPLPTKVNPLAFQGAKLVQELARTGWDVPGFDTEIHTSDHRDGTIRRQVSSVSFHTPEGKLTLGYYSHGHNGTYSLSNATWEGGQETAFYSDGSGRGRDKESVAKVRSAIITAIERLRQIDSFPGHDDVTDEGDPVMRKLCHVEPIPAPEDFPPLYSWAERNDTYRLAGKHDVDGEPYGLAGNGWRLLSLGAHDGKPVDPRAYRGFTYASADPAVRGSHPIYDGKDEELPVELKLKYLNDVFVFDRKAFVDAREAGVAQAIEEGRDRCTDQELNSWTLAAARTFVPYVEYDGSYSDPVILIGRRMFAEENRLMRGPISVRRAGTGIEASLCDEETGLEMILSSTPYFHPGSCRHVLRIARDAAYVTDRKVKVSAEIRNLVEASPEPSLDLILGRP